MTKKIIPLPRPRRDGAWAERTIRRLAHDWEKVVFTAHAQDRQDERDIDDEMVLEVLQKGSVTETPKKSEYGGYVATITKPNMVGTREIGVVCEIWKNEDGLEIITVMWVDQK